ncbi:DUF6712 family protein [Larkinella sp. GY13]|uniref:DUF6712 family protein n=1 Tax=Larkinella sp. GY13 TaxID=3453720 RepID=UPI003EE90C41
MMLTQEILKAQLGSLQASMEEETVAPFCRHAERWFRDEIGPDLYAFLQNETDSELLRLAHSTLAWQAYSLAFPHQKFRVGDLGMMKMTPQGAIAVTKWEYVDSRDANLSMLDLSLEYFFRELEAIRPAAWTGSAAFGQRNRHFLRSAGELADLLPIAGRNYRFFQKLVPFIDDVERELIRATLTAPVYRDLLTRWRDATTAWTLEEEELIELIRPAVAYLAVFQAWPYLPLSFSEIGIAERRQKDGTGGEEVAADGGQRNHLRRQLEQDGQIRLARIRTFLDETATPTRFAGYYQANLSGPALAADDFTDKPHVIL